MLSAVFAALEMKGFEETAVLDVIGETVTAKRTEDGWLLAFANDGDVTILFEGGVQIILHITLNIQFPYGVPTGKTGYANDSVIWTEYQDGKTYTVVYSLLGGSAAAGKDAAILRGIGDDEVTKRVGVIVLEEGITGIGWSDEIQQETNTDVFKGLL